jgi:hypothetical protein
MESRSISLNKLTVNIGHGGSIPADSFPITNETGVLLLSLCWSVSLARSRNALIDGCITAEIKDQTKGRVARARQIS